MASFASERDKSRCPTHPGLLLREDILPPLGRPKAEIAKWLSVSRQYLSQILCEDRPVSAGVAGRFGRMFGNEPLECRPHMMRGMPLVRLMFRGFDAEGL